MSRAREPQNADHPVDPDFDPLDPDYLADPYPYFAKFRKEAPIFYAPKIDFWVVSRYEDIAKIVKDPETFSNVRVQEPLHPLTDDALAKLKAGVRVRPKTSPPATASPWRPRKSGPMSEPPRAVGSARLGRCSRQGTCSVRWLSRWRRLWVSCSSTG